MEKLTEREHEILNILKQEPMIAQEALAARLKITRSAAAVHISNLIKKGFVLGRGYVFNEKTGVVVIGSSFLHIKGTAGQKGSIQALNAGKINLASSGGVCSVAQHLTLLSVPTILLSAIGRDNAGDQMVYALNKAGVNINHVLRSKRLETGKIITLINESGITEWTLTDKGINSLLEKEFITHKEHILANCQFLVFDTSLSREVIEEILKVAEETNIPVAVLPVTLSDLEMVKENLSKLTLLTLNKDQLAAVTGGSVADPEQAARTGMALINQGLQVLVITLGEQGVYLLTQRENIYLPNSPTQVIDTDSASDAVLAGLLYGLLKGFPYRQAVRLGIRAAAIASSRSPSSEGLEEDDLTVLYQE